MTTLDSQLYNAVSETLNGSEQYLGRIEYAWTYCTVFYTAESTESVEFSLLDKVICGILRIDGTLSWAKIGEILSELPGRAETAPVPHRGRAPPGR